MSQVGKIGNGGGGSGTVTSLVGNDSIVVPPNGSGEINVVGSGGVTTSGDIPTNTLTISVSGSGLSWTDQGTSFNASSNNGYFATASLTATLPASPSQGDTIIISCDTALVVTVQANTGQTIRIGDLASSSAGTISSTAIGDSVYLVFRNSNSEWFSISTEGSWNII